MVTKADVKRLLKKGLTGWEAGLLVFEDSWLVSRKQEGFLSASDLASLKSSLKREKDIQDYNTLIGLYRTADFIDRQAQTALLAAVAMIERAAGLGYIRLAPILASEMLETLPPIMTEKQLQEEKQALRDRQRERKLQELEPMESILYERASELAPDTWWDEWEELEEWEGPGDPPTEEEFLKERYPEVWPQAAEDILKLIQAGKLQPVQLLQEDIDRLVEIGEEEEAYKEESGIRQAWDEWTERIETQEVNPPPHYTGENRRRLLAFSEDRDRLEREAYERAKKKASQKSLAKLMDSLEQYRDGSLDSQEAGRLLDYTFCLGEELHESGLDEWKHNIEDYWEGWYERDLDESRVAIVKEPKTYQVDERGHYKPASLEMWPFTPMMEDEDFSELKSSITDLAMSEMGEMLARRQVLEDVSHYIGLALHEMIEAGIWALLRPAIGRYNTLAELVSEIEIDSGSSLLDMFGQESISLDDLKAPPGELAEVRAWIADALGDDWWKRAKENGKEPRSILPIPDYLQEAGHES